MSINVNEWKLKRSGSILGQILKFELCVEQEQVISKSLDGTVYIQTIGEMLDYADISLLCTWKERIKLNEAAADGAYVQAIYRDTTYHGYIEGIPEWNTVYPHEYYSCSIKFLIEAS